MYKLKAPNKIKTKIKITNKIDNIIADTEEITIIIITIITTIIIEGKFFKGFKFLFRNWNNNY